MAQNLKQYFKKNKIQFKTLHTFILLERAKIIINSEFTLITCSAEVHSGVNKVSPAARFFAIV